MKEILEKEIEELAKLLGFNCRYYRNDGTCDRNVVYGRYCENCHSGKPYIDKAKLIVDKGYRKEKNMAKEIFDRLIKIANTDSVDGIANPNKGYISVGMLKAWAIEYGVEIDE